LHDAKGEAKLRQAELKALSSGATSNPASRQTNVEAVQLENAKQHLNDVEQLYRAGLDTPLNYTRAQWDVKVLEAEQTGDTLKAAKARLDRAGEILKLVDSMYRGGLGTQVDLRDAQQEVKRCRAEFDAARGTPVPQFGQPATTRSVWQSGDPPPGSVAVTQEAREMDGKPGATHPATNPALAAQPAILDFRIAAWIDDKIGKPTGNLFPLSAAVQHVQDR
jgi:hypothetical protein